MCIIKDVNCPSGRFLISKNSMNISEYIKETRAEMKHVNWPTRSQAINYSLLVIGISVVTAVILGLFDFVFSLGLEKIISL